MLRFLRVDRVQLAACGPVTAQSRGSIVTLACRIGRLRAQKRAFGFGTPSAVGILVEIAYGSRRKNHRHHLAPDRVARLRRKRASRRWAGVLGGGESDRERYLQPALHTGLRHVQRHRGGVPDSDSSRPSGHRRGSTTTTQHARRRCSICATAISSTHATTCSTSSTKAPSCRTPALVFKTRSWMPARTYLPRRNGRNVTMMSKPKKAIPYLAVGLSLGGCEGE